MDTGICKIADGDSELRMVGKEMGAGRVGIPNEMLQSGTEHMFFEWRWRERSFNTAWMQVVPKTPRSRARSHSFGQLPSWLEAILCTWNWEG